jgi:hypothetical protein
VTSGRYVYPTEDRSRTTPRQDETPSVEPCGSSFFAVFWTFSRLPQFSAYLAPACRQAGLGGNAVGRFVTVNAYP